MVSEVVRSKSSGVGKANGQVGEDGEEPVCQWGAEGQIVADLVDSEEQVLVGGCANYICGEEVGGGEDRCRAESVGTDELEGHDSEDEIFRERLGAAKSGHFRVGFDDGLSTGSVGLFGVGPEELVFR